MILLGRLACIEGVQICWGVPHMLAINRSARLLDGAEIFSDGSGKIS